MAIKPKLNLTTKMQKHLVYSIYPRVNKLKNRPSITLNLHPFTIMETTPLN